MLFNINSTRSASSPTYSPHGSVPMPVVQVYDSNGTVLFPPEPGVFTDPPLCHPVWQPALVDEATGLPLSKEFASFHAKISQDCTSVALEALGVSVSAWTRFQEETVNIGGVVADLTLNAARVAAVFANDKQDGHFLAATAACGAAYALEPLDITEWYQVDNYVPEMHEDVMNKEINKEASARRILPALDWQVEGEAALGIVVKERKGKTKNRPTWDFSRPETVGLNARILIPKEKFSTVRTAYQYMRPGYFMYKVDLSEAFRTVPISSMLWSKHAFRWAGVRYFDTRLPFGARSAPGIFHRFTRAIVSRLRAEGLTVVGFIDDFWGVAATEAEAQKHYRFVIEFLAFLGFLVNEEKCIRPAQEVDFLGIMLSTKGACSAWIEEFKIRELQQGITEMLEASSRSASSRPSPVPKKQLQRVLGRVVFASQVVESLTLYMRHPFSCLHAADLRHGGGGMTVLSRDAVLDLKFIQELLWSHNGKKVRLSKQQVKRDNFATDASSELGMGAILDFLYFALSWKELKTFPQRPFYPFSPHNKSSGNINYLELFCVYWAISLWGPLLAGKSLRVVVRIDNQAAIGMIKKLWGKADYIPLLKELQLLCLKFDILLQPEYINTKHNVLADALSRLEMESFYQLRKQWRQQAVRARDDQDWRLMAHLWHDIDREFGPFDTDACVDPDRTNSFCFSSWSESDDATKADFHGLNVWCNPPFKLMLEIVLRFVRCKMEQPNGTTACFLIPWWIASGSKPEHPVCSFIRAHPDIFLEVRHFEVGEILFSAPSDFHGGRTIWGGVRWPVKVFRVSPAPLPYNPLV